MYDTAKLIFFLIICLSIGVGTVLLGVYFIPDNVIPPINVDLPSPPYQFGEWLAEHKEGCQICRFNFGLRSCVEKEEKLSELQLSDPEWKWLPRRELWDYVGPDISGYRWNVLKQVWEPIYE